jgi:hypothetical protein
MPEEIELVAIWLPEGLYLTPPPAGYLEEYDDLIFAELDPLIARKPDTGETVAEAHVWVIDTPDLPADREAGLLSEDAMRQLLNSAADYAQRLQRLSPKHRAAFQVILRTPADEFRAMGYDETPDYNNMKAKDAFKTMHRLGYAWDGETWRRDSQPQ